MIPFLDLKAVNLRYAAGFEEAFFRVLKSSWYIQGHIGTLFSIDTQPLLCLCGILEPNT